MSNFQLVKVTQFNGVEFDCYKDTQQQDISGDFWATREQIGRLLEYENPDISIANIHNRHTDRLGKFSTLIKLIRVEGERNVEREVTIYNFKGLLEICRFSSQPKADAVMDFLWDIADEIRRTGSYNVNKDSTDTPEDRKRARDLEAARILQGLVEKPNYPLKKIVRLVITKRIFKLATGEDLLLGDNEDNSNSNSGSTQLTLNFDINNSKPKQETLDSNVCDLVHKLKALRKSLDISQDALANLFGVARNTITRWETGVYTPSEQNIQLGNEILNMSVEDLLKRLSGNSWE